MQSTPEKAPITPEKALIPEKAPITPEKAPIIPGQTEISPVPTKESPVATAEKTPVSTGQNTPEEPLGNLKRNGWLNGKRKADQDSELDRDHGLVEVKRTTGCFRFTRAGPD